MGEIGKIVLLGFAHQTATEETMTRSAGIGPNRITYEDLICPGVYYPRCSGTDRWGSHTSVVKIHTDPVIAYVRLKPWTGGIWVWEVPTAIGHRATSLAS